MPETSVTTNQNHCLTCGKALPPAKRKNRPREYCNSACRSKAYWDREESDMRAALAELRKLRGVWDRLEAALSVRTSRKPRTSAQG